MNFIGKAAVAAAATAALAGLAPAAASAAASTAATPAAPAASVSGTFSCVDTTVTRAAYKRNASGTIDAAGDPVNVTIYRTATGAVDITSAQPTLDNGYAGGYYLSHYGLNTWLVGSVTNGIVDTYYLLLPASIPAGSFTGEVIVDFGTAPGDNQYGSNQFAEACTVS